MQTQNIRREERQGMSYRDYSRRRYGELKALFGDRIRESEIIQRIIREWDDMKMAQNISAGRNMEAAATPVKQEGRMIPMDIKNKSKLKSTSAKKDQERPENMMMMKDINVQPFDASPSMKKSKPIYKLKATYIMFYRENFKMLKLKHPNWAPAQITRIIRLLWLKEKSKMMTKKLMSPKSMMKMRKFSGRMFFKRFMLKQGKNRAQIDMMWKRLPRDSKRMYQMAGDPETPTMPPKNMLKMTVMTGRNTMATMDNDLMGIMMKK